MMQLPHDSDLLCVIELNVHSTMFVVFVCCGCVRLSECSCRKLPAAMIIKTACWWYDQQPKNYVVIVFWSDIDQERTTSYIHIHIGQLTLRSKTIINRCRTFHMPTKIKIFILYILYKVCPFYLYLLSCYRCSTHSSFIKFRRGVNVYMHDDMRHCIHHLTWFWVDFNVHVAVALFPFDISHINSCG